MEGRTRTEAADALRCTEGTIRGRLARARILLRSRLTRRGIAPAAALAALAQGSEGRRRRAEGTGRERNTGCVPPGNRAAAAALSQGVIRTVLLRKLTLSVAVLGGAILVAWAAIAALVAGEDQAPVTAAPRVAAAPSGAILLDDPEKAALHGRVVSPDGTPVAGARVWVNVPDHRSRPAPTPRGGSAWDPSSRSTGTLTLIVDADGFARL